MGTVRLNGWTGGQYSLVRALLGGYVLVRLVATLAAGGHPAWVTAGLAVGALAALALALGLLDRTAALVAAAAWVVHVVLPLEERTVGEPLLAVAFLIHLGLPPAPYGSWAARGRTDPASDWRFPAGLHGLVGLVAVLGLALDGVLRVAGILPNEAWSDRMLLGFELGFLLASPFRALRPLAWTAMLLAVGVYAVANGGGALAWVPLLLLAFDPAWLPPATSEDPALRPELVFYDGECGLCHRFLRFLLSEDPDGAAFRFAPLQGPTFEERIEAELRERLPDSLVLLRADGGLLVRSDATVYALLKLGGFWRVVGRVLAWLPRGLRDTGYDTVARVRKRVFPQPKALCPLLPAHLADRFLA